MNHDHVVVKTSTAQYPSDNGWLYYYCQTCPDVPSVCAKTFDHVSGFDYEGYSAALHAFNATHPHRDVLQTYWAQ